MLQRQQSVVVGLRDAVQGLELDVPPVRLRAVIHLAVFADRTPGLVRYRPAAPLASPRGCRLTAPPVLVPPPLLLARRRAELAVRATQRRVREHLPALHAGKKRNTVQGLPVQRVVAGLAVSSTAIASVRRTAELGQRLDLAAPAALLLLHATDDPRDGDPPVAGARQGQGLQAHLRRPEGAKDLAALDCRGWPPTISAREKDVPRPVLRHNVTPLRQACGVSNDKDNDVTPIGQRDAPGGEVAQRNLLRPWPPKPTM